MEPLHNLTQLADQMAARLGVSKVEARAALQEVFGTIASTANKGIPVTIRGFGVFAYKRRAGRAGRNPRTGEPVAVPPIRVLAFKAARMTRRSLGRASK